MSLQHYINKRVLILTVDGRTLLGTLLSTDQLTNLVLSQTVERIIRTPDDPEPSSQVEHGLYLIRGDNVVICGEVDEEIDGGIDWAKVKGAVVKGTKSVWSWQFAVPLAICFLVHSRWMHDTSFSPKKMKTRMIYMKCNYLEAAELDENRCSLKLPYLFILATIWVASRIIPGLDNLLLQGFDFVRARGFQNTLSTLHLNRRSIH